MKLDSIATVGKGFGAKREKQDGKDGEEQVIARLKFAQCFVDRDQIDLLCKQTPGWCASALYDDLGAPRLRVELKLVNAEFSFTGSFRQKGAAPRAEHLTLGDATLGNVVITPTALGGELAGEVSWVARGDEVEDLTDLLGQLVAVRAEIDVTRGGQRDLVDEVAAEVRKAMKDGAVQRVPPKPRKKK